MMDNGLDSSRHPKWKTFLFYAAFVCLMLAGFLTVFSLRSQPTDPYDLTPQILVDGKVYYWAGMALKQTGADTPGKQVSAGTDNRTYLPEGFTEYGSFLSTVSTPPAEELQLQADFGAYGTVYRNPEVPEVIYILMTTDSFEGQYVRFASREIFDGDRIVWQGKQYAAPFRKGTAAPLDTLPEGAVSVGTLHFIGADYIPEKDLETNCISDDYAMALEGREVFADPGDPDCIYVCRLHTGSDGGYYKCPLWTESYGLQYVE